MTDKNQKPTGDVEMKDATQIDTAIAAKQTEEKKAEPADPFFGKPDECD